MDAGQRPQADYDALAYALQAIPGGEADILDINCVESTRSWLVRIVRRMLGNDAALALLGHLRSRGYDVVFSHNEAVGIAFALLSYLRLHRPRLVTNAYYLIGRRNSLWFRFFKIYRRIDKILVLAREQYEVGRTCLKIPDNQLVLVDCCGYVDRDFFSSPRDCSIIECQICSTGLEFRDYATLVRAVADLPHVRLKIDPSSPWSRHRTDLDEMQLPANVEIFRTQIGAIRQLYAESAVVAIPLHPNSIGAGTTTLVEAMLAGKPVIVTSSPDGIFAARQDLVDGKNVILVRPSDVSGWRAAIERLLADREWRLRIAAEGRVWAERKADRGRWLEIMIDALSGRSSNRPETAPRCPEAPGTDATNLVLRALDEPAGLH